MKQNYNGVFMLATPEKGGKGGGDKGLTSNIEHPTFNVERRTGTIDLNKSNQVSVFRCQKMRETFDMEYWSDGAMGSSDRPICERFIMVPLSAANMETNRWYFNISNQSYSSITNENY